MGVISHISVLEKKGETRGKTSNRLPGRKIS
jgi:hypothetical protein